MASLQRIARLRELASSRRYDAVVLRNNPDLRWLTSAERVFDFETAHTAFITHDALFLHTDSRYFNSFEERMGKNGPWRIDQDDISHVEWIVKKAAETGARVIALEDSLSLAFFSALTRAAQDHSLALSFVQLHGDLVRMRAVKDEEELAIMREAQAITDRAFTHMCEYIQVGMTEKQIQTELDNFMYLNGADGLAFGSIVATGPNTANPHAMPGQRVVEKGQFVLMDFGASVRDYCSDMTRTVCMGQPSAQQREIYDIVRSTNEACAKLMVPGASCREIHEHAVAMIAEAGYGGKFQHGLGHGVGIEIHELPNFGVRSNTVLEIGNVVTNEPGIYLAGIGGVRIEDYGVITEDGIELFTQSTHELQIL